MFGRFRTLLIGLLVLATPLQGAAAATMAFCPAQQHLGMPSAAADHGVAGHRHDAPDAAVMHHHAMADASAATAEEPTASAQASLAADDSHSCSACGSCCTASALVSCVPALPVAEAAAGAFARIGANVDPFAADGPERPPRPPLV